MPCWTMGSRNRRFTQQDGFFVVTLPGPAGDYERIRTPENAGGPVTPAIEAVLTARQKKMLTLLAAGEELTSRRCEMEFGVSRPITARDFSELMRLGLAERIGSGRSTRYRAAIVK